jgi:tetratricopeptide (TPR) repeat protein
VAVLRDDLDADTVRALGELATLEVFAGSPDADALSAEALALGQDLPVDEATLGGLFTTRGNCHAFAGRNPQAAAYFREAARLAGQASDTRQLGAALLNLADTVTGTDPQEQAAIAAAEAFTAAARGQPAAALRHARAALDHASALEISHEVLRWAWPLAARAAHDLADTATTGELLALLDGYPAGQLAPMQRAERDLACARLAAADDDPDAAAAAFTAAINGLRQHSTPYHLAHGLLDHAAHLATRGEAEAATAAVGEALGIGQRLSCQPLLDRADTIQPARPRTAAP